jgi:hypothetical protein
LQRVNWMMSEGKRAKKLSRFFKYAKLTSQFILSIFWPFSISFSFLSTYKIRIKAWNERLLKKLTAKGKFLLDCEERRRKFFSYIRHEKFSFLFFFYFLSFVEIYIRKYIMKINIHRMDRLRSRNIAKVKFFPLIFFF